MNKDQQIIRELARQVMELANDEKQQDMNRRFRATNDLKLVRPPVLMDEIPWYQMDIDGELVCECEDPRARKAEEEFRRILYRRRHFKADTFIEPFYRVPMAYDSTGIGVRVEEQTLKTDDTNNIISHHYEDILKEDGSEELIQIPTFTARPDKDEATVAYYTELLWDTMPVKLCGHRHFYHAPWDLICRFRGMETILMDLYDRPEHLHAIRRRFHEVFLAELDFIEKHLHVDPTNPTLHCTPAYVSGLAEDGLKATWLRTMAQPFSDISPDMHDEFEVQYVLEVCNRFAYTYYGCCEPLDRRLDVIFQIPNLRKIGVSPWAKEEVMAERLGGKFVYARKPNPAHVAIATDPAVIRAETEKSVRLCQQYGCPAEFVLKDISTVSHKPENLILWAETVSDVLDEYYGK